MEISKLDASQRGMLSLAYLGDAVYELLVREHLMADKNFRPNKLNEQARRFVTANAQAKAVEYVELTKEEADIFRRAKNSKPQSVPKSTEIGVYKTATGLEAVFGYLHLTGQHQRIHTLFEQILSHIEEKKDGE